VDPDLMMMYLQEFARWEKLSGTSSELESFRYLKSALDRFGYKTELVLHDAFISLPGTARVTIGTEAFPCITHSFSLSSPVQGLLAPLVYGEAGRMGDLTNSNGTGKIVLLDGIATPGATLQAGRAGAVGQIHISPQEHLHEMCVSPVWGSPSSETLDQLPRTVVVSISHEDGERLKARLKAGESIDATIHAVVDTGWRKTPLLVADLMPEGENGDGPFVMLSGHHDTWYLGVMDNGAANATMLEVARLCAGQRGDWKRGLRLCFWSGHSHGRYSGSAWYADQHWSELERRCVAHVNVDSTGGRGATVLTDAPASAELMPLAREAVRTHGAQELSGLRVGRAGDQSFWGIGIPSLFMGVSEQPAVSRGKLVASVSGTEVVKKGGGFGWWWHTPDDTLDKIDLEILVRDTQIYVHAVWRLLSEAALPLDYTIYAEHLRAVVAELKGELDGQFDLSPILLRVEKLATRARAVHARVQSDLDDESVRCINHALMRASRVLVPVDSTSGDRFIHDPALPMRAFPILDPVRRLAQLAPETDEYRFASVRARQAVNSINHALDAALDILRPPT
jgi:hypothetical protein